MTNYLDGPTEPLRTPPPAAAYDYLFSSPSPEEQWLEDGSCDRLILSLSRDGSNFIGRMVILHYRAVDVTRRNKETAETDVVQRMLVDAAHPTEIEMTIKIERPLLAADVVQALRDQLWWVLEAWEKRQTFRHHDSYQVTRWD